METRLTAAAERHLPFRITQYYLAFNTDECDPP